MLISKNILCFCFQIQFPYWCIFVDFLTEIHCLNINLSPQGKDNKCSAIYYCYCTGTWHTYQGIANIEHAYQFLYFSGKFYSLPSFLKNIDWIAINKHFFGKDEDFSLVGRKSFSSASYVCAENCSEKKKGGNGPLGQPPLIIFLPSSPSPSIPLLAHKLNGVK